MAFPGPYVMLAKNPSGSCVSPALPLPLLVSCLSLPGSSTGAQGRAGTILRQVLGFWGAVWVLKVA